MNRASSGRTPITNLIPRVRFADTKKAGLAVKVVCKDSLLTADSTDFFNAETRRRGVEPRNLQTKKRTDFRSLLKTAAALYATAISARRVCAPHGPKCTVGMPSGVVHEPFGSVHESSLRAHEPSGAAHGRVWPAHEAAGRAHGWVGSPHGWPEAAHG